MSEGELAQFGLMPLDVCDFSVNTNPLGPAPNVLDAIAAADWTRYPGDDEPRLRTAFALRDRVEPEQVVLGNGSVELPRLVALATLRPGDRLLVVGPAFGEYARAGRVAGAEVVDERWRSEPLLECGNLAVLGSLTKDPGPPGCNSGIYSPRRVCTRRTCAARTRGGSARGTRRLPEDCIRLLSAVQQLMWQS